MKQRVLLPVVLLSLVLLLPACSEHHAMSFDLGGPTAAIPAVSPGPCVEPAMVCEVGPGGEMVCNVPATDCSPPLPTASEHRP